MHIADELVVHQWCSSVLRGGAGIAALRLHRALSTTGVDSRLHCGDPGGGASADLSGAQHGQLLIQEEIIARGRPGTGQTRFSLPTGGLQDKTILGAGGIHHLHWINDFLGLGDLAALATEGRQVVWTFHDQWAFTGGCHYPAGCRGSEADCRACPQLAQTSQEWAARLWATKRDLFSYFPPVAICPTDWMARAATRSSLWNGARTVVIPNAVDLRTYRPGDRRRARTKLGIPAESPTVLFVADHVAEHRKGYDLLAEILPALAKRLPGLVCLSVGGTAGTVQDGDLTTISVGRIENDAEMVRCYRAADLVVVPSREDNLPNILVEAAACGIPAVGFAIGGIPEAIEDGTTGLLAGSPDPGNLLAAIEAAFADRERMIAWGDSARKSASGRYDPSRVAQQHLTLYRELAATSSVRTSHRKPVPQWPEAELIRTASESRLANLKARLDACDADRAMRLQLIERQAAELDAVQRDHKDRGELIEQLNGQMVAAERELSAERARRIELQQLLERLEVEYRPLLDEVDAARVQVMQTEGALQRESELRAHAETSMALLRKEIAEINADRDARLRLSIESDERLAACEADRTQRLHIIHMQAAELEALRADHQERGSVIGRLTTELLAVTVDRAALAERAERIEQQLSASEHDRTQRLDLIGRQAAELDTLRADHHERGELIARLDAELSAVTADRAALAERAKRIEQQLAASEHDRTQRLDVIGKQAAELDALRADHLQRGELIARLDAELSAVMDDRAALAERAQRIEQQLAASEHDRTQRLDVIGKQAAELDALRADHLQRGELIARLDAELSAVTADRAALAERAQRIEQQFAASERDRTQRLDIIGKQAAELDALRADHLQRGELIARLDAELSAVSADRAALAERAQRIEQQLTASERDRTQRLDLIGKQATELDALRADHLQRGELIARLDAELSDVMADRAALAERAGRAETLLAISERDRAERLTIIDAQARELDALRPDHQRRGEAIDRLLGDIEALRGDLAHQSKAIQRHIADLDRLRADLRDSQARAECLDEHLRLRDAELSAQRSEIERLIQRLGLLEAYLADLRHRHERRLAGLPLRLLLPKPPT